MPTGDERGRNTAHSRSPMSDLRVILMSWFGDGSRSWAQPRRPCNADRSATFRCEPWIRDRVSGRRIAPAGIIAGLSDHRAHVANGG